MTLSHGPHSSISQIQGLGHCQQLSVSACLLHPGVPVSSTPMGPPNPTPCAPGPAWSLLASAQSPESRHPRVQYLLGAHRCLFSCCFNAPCSFLLPFSCGHCLEFSMWLCEQSATQVSHPCPTIVPPPRPASVAWGPCTSRPVVKGPLSSWELAPVTRSLSLMYQLRSSTRGVAGGAPLLRHRVVLAPPSAQDSPSPLCPSVPWTVPSLAVPLSSQKQSCPPLGAHISFLKLSLGSVSSSSCYGYLWSCPVSPTWKP